MHGKPHLDARKLDHARLTAARIDADPALLDLAHEHLERACQRRGWLVRAQTEWLQIRRERFGRPRTCTRRPSARLRQCAVRRLTDSSLAIRARAFARRTPSRPLATLTTESPSNTIPAPNPYQPSLPGAPHARFETAR